MIQANELRIGNWVRSNLTEREFQITAKDIVYINIDPSVVSPIPLTEERLLKFGFVTFGSVLTHFFNSAIIAIGKDGSAGLYNSLETFRRGSSFNQLPKIKSIHQLQNLYHAISGEELILNQEQPKTYQL